MSVSEKKITDPTELHNYYEQLLAERRKEGVDTSEAEAIVKKAIFTYQCISRTMDALRKAIALLGKSTGET